MMKGREDILAEKNRNPLSAMLTRRGGEGQQPFSHRHGETPTRPLRTVVPETEDGI